MASLRATTRSGVGPRRPAHARRGRGVPEPDLVAEGAILAPIGPHDASPAQVGRALSQQLDDVLVEREHRVDLAPPADGRDEGEELVGAVRGRGIAQGPEGDARPSAVLALGVRGEHPVTGPLQRAAGQRAGPPPTQSTSTHGRREGARFACIATPYPGERDAQTCASAPEAAAAGSKR